MRLSFNVVLMHRAHARHRGWGLQAMTLPRPVDLEHLARYTGGDARVNAEILTLFANQSTDLLHQLDTALTQNDSKTWRDINHSIKGGARGIGAFQLADTAAAAENADPASDA